MKYIPLKSILFLSFCIHLCSCIMYVQEEKYEKTYTVKETVSQLPSTNQQQEFFNQLINFDYYTEANITKLFGIPSQTTRDATQTTLSYQYEGKTPQNIIAPLLPLITYNNGDNIYHYAFVLSNGKLKEINIQALKQDVKAIGLLIPPYIHTTRFAQYDPFTVNQSCPKELSNIYYTVPHHPNSKIQTSCSYNKLLDSSVLTDNIFDASQGKQGYTRSTIITLYHHNNQIFHATKKDYEKYFKETFIQADSQRLTDISPVKETNFTGTDITCKIYSKKGKDPYATNRKQYPYLILDAASAFCTFKNNDILMTIQNSNRYPEIIEKENHIYEDLINTLKTVKSNTPRSLNQTSPIFK